MAGILTRGVLAGALVLLGGLGQAAEPVLPAPRPVMTEMVPLSFVRPDPYAVWQNYGVDQRGYFRPLVVPSYGGPRYVATGDPYPWWQNHPRYVTPMIANAATFGAAPPLVVVAPAVERGWERMPYAE